MLFNRFFINNLYKDILAPNEKSSRRFWTGESHVPSTHRFSSTELWLWIAPRDVFSTSRLYRGNHHARRTFSPHICRFGRSILPFFPCDRRTKPRTRPNLFSHSPRAQCDPRREQSRIESRSKCETS